MQENHFEVAVMVEENFEKNSNSSPKSETKSYKDETDIPVLEGITCRPDDIGPGTNTNTHSPAGPVSPAEGCITQSCHSCTDNPNRVSPPTEIINQDAENSHSSETVASDVFGDAPGDVHNEKTKVGKSLSVFSATSFEDLIESTVDPDQIEHCRSRGVDMVSYVEDEMWKDLLNEGKKTLKTGHSKDGQGGVANGKLSELGVASTSSDAGSQEAEGSTHGDSLTELQQSEVDGGAAEGGEHGGQDSRGLMGANVEGFQSPWDDGRIVQMDTDESDEDTWL